MIRLRAENERSKSGEYCINKRGCLERRERRSATQGEKAAFVHELRKERHRLNDLLDTIGLSRSTYYYELKKTDKVKETPIYRLKLLLYSMRTRKVTVQGEYIMNFWTAAFRWIPSVFSELWISLHCLVNAQKESIILTKVMLAKLRTTLLIEISAPRNHCKSGRTMCHSSICRGENAIFLRFWIWTRMKLFLTISLPART